MPGRTISSRSRSSAARGSGASGGAAGSVHFSLNDNQNYRTENTAPFTLEGDTNGKFNAWKPGPGTHTIVATPFARRGASGPRGKPLTLRLMVNGRRP